MVARRLKLKIIKPCQKYSNLLKFFILNNKAGLCDAFAG